MGGRGAGLVLSVREQLECIELCLGTDDEPSESLWVSTKEKTGKGDIVVGVCYKPPDQEEPADETLYRQTGAASHSQALVLMGNFTHCDICWRDSTAGHKQARRFLECIVDNFITQVIEEPKRACALLDLICTKKEGLVGDVKTKGSLGCSNYERVEFRILRGARRLKSKLTTLTFRRADFVLFKWLLGSVPWDMALKARESQETW